MGLPKYDVRERNVGVDETEEAALVIEDADNMDEDEAEDSM